MSCEAERLNVLNECDEDSSGKYVLYWMQHGQRARHNPALNYAIEQANRLGVGCVCCFGLMDNYPDGTERAYAFMLEGLAEIGQALHDRGIKFVMRHGLPAEVALSCAEEAVLIVTDRGYLRHQRQWRREVAERAAVAVHEVEGEVVVPVETASNKREHAARTIRKKINGQRDRFLHLPDELTPDTNSLSYAIKGDLDWARPEQLLQTITTDRSVKPSARFKGGTSAALERLQAFIDDKLNGYDDERNEPYKQHTSHLSPYLHYGQISPVEVALAVRDAKTGKSDDREGYLEELLVRRELAANFVWFEPDYDSFTMLPGWAQETLAEHKDDERQHRYTRQELADAATHDAYWNAAMREMVKTGYMHNYMRMYWGKKILEWCNTPQYAYETTLYLNNKYFLDGRDMNSFANVAWIFGNHDRGWTERAVFGKVRYMAASGLERKFDIDKYVEWVETL